MAKSDKIDDLCSKIVSIVDVELDTTELDRLADEIEETELLLTAAKVEYALDKSEDAESTVDDLKSQLEELQDSLKEEQKVYSERLNDRKSVSKELISILKEYT